MIKLLALDLDGTLLDSQGNISERNASAIQKAETNGVTVTIATGRRFRDALPVALEIGFDAPIVTHNGALLKYAESLKTFDVSLIDPGTTEEIIRVGKESGGEALVSTDPSGKGVLLFERISDENIPVQKYIVWAKRLHGDDAGESIHEVENLIDVVGAAEVIHISFSGICSDMKALQAILEKTLEDSVNIMATVYPNLDFTLLDILPPGASKGIGLSKLASKNGLARENIMVIGDNFNDLEMLEYAGTPVVMGNADTSLLERSEFYTTLDNNQSGVAAAIDKFILGDVND
jgi:Cof subfamily protein (haloacid dehalogenase superfamily)